MEDDEDDLEKVLKLLEYKVYDEDDARAWPPEYKNLTLEKVVHRTGVTFDKVQEQFDALKARNNALEARIDELEVARQRQDSVAQAQKILIEELTKRLAALEERNKILDEDWGKF